MKPTISVTDHAVLRWMERAYDVDVEAVRRRIRECVAHGVEAAESIGQCDQVVVLVDGMRYVVKDRAVVTITRAGRR